MDITLEEAIKPRFSIVSIEKCTPPKDMPGKDWYRYIVGDKGNKITGYKEGTLKSVTEHVEEFTEGLNERSVKGYSPSARATRPKKPAN